MEEIWKDCPHYSGYMASNLSNILSLNYMNTGKPHLLKLNIIRGYLTVHLPKRKSHVAVHRMVADAFVPNPYGKPCVNHKDENKLNNCSENLEWVTYKENNSYGTRLERVSKTNRANKKCDKPVLCVETGETYSSTHEVARKHGYDQSRISVICRGGGKTAYGYHWKYIETKEG